MKARTRRRIIWAAIAFSVLNLISLIAVPQYRHHLPAGAVTAAALAVTAISAGLVYLAKNRSRP
jgi:archaellum biogenesis protein FlaJ (TadC family)